MKRMLRFQLSRMVRCRGIPGCDAAVLPGCMRRIPGGGRGQLAVGSVRHPVSRRGDGVVWNRPGVERVFGALAVSGGSPLRYLFPEDRKNRCLAPVVTRSSYGDYLSSQVLASGLGSASVVFLPLLLNLLLCYLAFPSNHNIKLASYQGNMYAAVLLGENRLYTSLGTTYFLLPLYFFSPFLYQMMYLTVLGLFSGLCGAAVTALSFRCFQSKILLFLPLYAVSVITLYARGIWMNAALHSGARLFRPIPLRLSGAVCVAGL